MKGVACLSLAVAGIVAGPWLVSLDPLEQHREIANQAPAAGHWLGTDEYGRDVFSRFLSGGRWSVVTGGAATVVVLVLGWTFGGAAGYIGGWVDRAIMGLVELQLVLPWLYLLLAVRALLPLRAAPRTAFIILLLLIALVSWARPARLVRGMVLSLKERGYVEPARGFGVPPWKIFVRHILPGTYGLLATQALLLFPRLVLAEVTLSFLGLGAGEPDPSWGALLIPLKQAWLLHQEWWRALPALLMLPFFLGFAWAVRSIEDRLSQERVSQERVS